jgi:hypothetical protein
MSKRRNSSTRFAFRVLVALGAAVLLAGCTFMPGRATPFHPPADVAHIRLERQDSARIIVDKIWLERKEDGLFVRGYVMSKLGVDDTAGSHLIVSLRDASGTELRSASVDFAPRQIPQQRRPTGVSLYRFALDPLPPGTTSIVVTARDDRRAP